MDKYSTTKELKLTRKDGKIVDVIFYDNSDIDKVEILDIKKLKFEGMKTKDIKKSQIHDEVLKGEEKILLQNKNSKIVAGLSKRHLNKIISTVFTRDNESRHAYLKKELISNVDTIFYAAIPILKHPELKKQALYHNQIVHRFALPLKIGELIFFAMITVKERIDYQEMSIDEFSIYDLYSEAQENQKLPDSSSKVSLDDKPMTTLNHYQAVNEKSLDSSSKVSSRTFLSHYQVITYSINDLINFVNLNITKYQ